MGGQDVRLEPGRYTLAVDSGHGPAGVQRSDGSGVQVGVAGGRFVFEVEADEEVYYWWRGPAAPTGVRLMGVSGAEQLSERGTWPTGLAG
jgi:hypothetical protein